MSKYIGIDIGGMSVKGIAIDSLGKVTAEGAVPTEAGFFALADSVETLFYKLGGGEDSLIGIGCPGIIDSKNGSVVFSGNLNFEDMPLGKVISHRLGVPVKVVNDANAAALGEARFGAGKEYEDSVLVTLGTGVGGGIIIGNKLFEGYKSAGTEIGHMIIEKGGLPCSCGNCGCFEAYSSASALIKKTREAMLSSPESKMWNTYTAETVNGKTVFDYKDTDSAAEAVFNWYIDYLATGLINIANVFRPQAILIGGGISAQGENLIRPLRAKFNKMLFGGTSYAPVEIKTASLGNRAGVFGAAALMIAPDGV